MILIVGCGLSSAVIAERYANLLNKKVLIVEKREHIGGNCYDYIDSDTGILVNKYGAHLFHTNNETVWTYVNNFSKWIRWEHKVISKVNGTFVPMPVNITTVNTLCEQNIQDSSEMNIWLEENQTKYENITNSEEMAKSRVGDVLYNKLFKPYTIKQWNKDPSELDPSVLRRIPIRNSFDTRYFDDKYQALPEKGYTEFIKNILSNENIKIQLGVDFNEWRKVNDITMFEKIFYTGPIDNYFNNIHEKLEYRSIDFHIEKIYNTGYYQPNSVVNYPELDVSFTRIVEYKHFLYQKSPHTIIVSETTNDIGEPYYPVLTDKNKIIYKKYQELAEKEESEKNVVFVGRLANYKYFNMDEAIANSLDIFYSLNR